MRFLLFYNMLFDEQTIIALKIVMRYGLVESNIFAKPYFLVIAFKRIAISSRRLLNTSIGFGFARIIAVKNENKTKFKTNVPTLSCQMKCLLFNAFDGLLRLGLRRTFDGVRLFSFSRGMPTNVDLTLVTGLMIVRGTTKSL